MAVTAAPAGQDPRRVDIKRGNWRRQWQAEKSSGLKSKELPLIAHSIGTTISFSLTIFSRLRAADSITFGSLRS